MGVPSYFRWLISRYEKNIIRSKLHRDRLTGTVVLYLDFNGAIHPAVRSNPDLKRADMNAAVCTYLENIMAFVRPDELYIAIDGVAPAAKMNQQRDRRYKSVKEAHHMRVLNAKYSRPNPTDPVDFNMISPGTEFMADLQVALEEFIRQKTTAGHAGNTGNTGNTAELWSGLKRVTVNGANVPGEGEHKIMAEIRARGTDCIEHPVVYGLDADLIFLSMLNQPRIVLVRENVYLDNKAPPPSDTAAAYSYLDIRELTQILLKILDRSTSLTGLKGLGVKNNVYPDQPEMGGKSALRSDSVRLIRDYTFMCFLLGNDFLPHLPSLRIRDDSLADLIVFYKVTAWAQNGTGQSMYLLNLDLSINYPFLLELFAEIAHVEKEILLEQAETRRKSIRRFRERVKTMTPYDREKENYTYIEDKYDDLIDLGQPGWRIRYYREHVGLNHVTDTHFQAHVFTICQNYIEGCQWVIQYYTGRGQNWDYQYNYKVAPSATDLANFLANGFSTTVNWTPTEPVSPYVQLMSILPPDSHALLPLALQSLLTEKDSDIHYLYPIEFKLSLHGNRFLHECPPLLPYVDRTALKRIIMLRQADFTPAEQQRNALGVPIIFNF